MKETNKGMPNQHGVFDGVSCVNEKYMDDAHHLKAINAELEDRPKCGVCAAQT